MESKWVEVTKDAPITGESNSAESSGRNQQKLSDWIVDAKSPENTNPEPNSDTNWGTVTEGTPVAGGGSDTPPEPIEPDPDTAQVSAQNMNSQWLPFSYLDNIQDEKDPEGKVGLLVDEWGTWWDEEPGTISGHLYQQNALRDAFVAALSLNVFHKYTDRVKMANIAQIVNVLQSMILTDQEGTGHMVLTPTYHVFEMYTPFQEATYLPIDLESETMQVSKAYFKEKEGAKDAGYRPCPMLSASAAKTTDGSIVLAVTNVSLDKAQTIDFALEGYAAKTVSGRILTSKNVADFNDFQHPNVVAPAQFKDAKLNKGVLTVNIPAKSIVVLKIK